MKINKLFLLAALTISLLNINNVDAMQESADISLFRAQLNSSTTISESSDNPTITITVNGVHFTPEKLVIFREHLKAHIKEGQSVILNLSGITTPENTPVNEVLLLLTDIENIVSLDISNTFMNNTALQTIAASRYRPQLKYLNIYRTNIIEIEYSFFANQRPYVEIRSKISADEAGIGFICSVQ